MSRGRRITLEERTRNTRNKVARAQEVGVMQHALVVDLTDGRTISVPLAWYPRLMHATPEERGRWRLIGDREGIHWPDLDEDISIENLLLGRRSGESQSSFRKWLEHRRENTKRGE